MYYFNKYFLSRLFFLRAVVLRGNFVPDFSHCLVRWISVFRFFMILLGGSILLGTFGLYVFGVICTC